MATAVITDQSNKVYYTMLSSAATTMTLSGLDGDTDGDYDLDIEIRSAAASNTFKIQINGDDQKLDWFTYNGLVGGIASSSSWSVGQLTGVPSTWGNGDVIDFQGRLRARSGRVRIATMAAYANKSGVTGLLEMGRYSDLVANITTITVIAGQSSGLGAYSMIRAMRRLSTNPLSLTPSATLVEASSFQDNTVP